MIGTALSKNDLAAWRGLLARPGGSSLVASIFLYVTSALIIPLASNESLALLFIVGCAVFYYKQTHTVGSLILPAIPAMILFSISGSMMLPAIFFALVFGACSGVILLLFVKKPVHSLLFLLLPPAAVLHAWLLGVTPLVALTALLPLPVALVAGLALRRCTAFTPAVLSLSLTVGGSMLLVLTVGLAANGLLNLSFLQGFADTLADALIAALNEASALYAEAGVTIEISESAIRHLLAGLINLSPAILAICAMVTAYFIWRILSVLLVTLGILPRLPRFLVLPTMSVTAASLFILAYIVTLFANLNGATPAGTVAQNLALILEPGLALVGVGSLFGQQASRSCLTLICLIFLVYLVWSNPASALALAAFLGAIQVLMGFFQSLKNKGDT